MTNTAIRTRGLTHRFGAMTAVDDVDLTVEPGQVYGFLGRNGAGKTTLIRALLGLLTPTSGEVSLLGTPVRGGRTPSALWARVGYLVEGPGLYPGLTVLDHLRTSARYRRLPQSAVEEVVDRLDLRRYADVRADALSLGNRQRLGLALALVHRPRLVVLDEPVNGLDPAGVADVRDLLRSLADDGVTVFMSSHLISEVVRLSDRVGIIHAGRLIEELSADRLRTALRRRLILGFRTPELTRSAAAALEDHGIPTRADSSRLVATAAEAVQHPDQVVRRLVAAGAPPTHLAVETEDLEEHFLSLTGDHR